MSEFRFAKITNIEDEAEGIRTFYFDTRLRSRPGQFVMLWIPGLEEKPFAVGSEDTKGISVTVALRGLFTKRLFEYEKGDRINIRGPYGKPFFPEISDKNVALIGGGYGTAPLLYLAHELAKRGNNIYFFEGAKSKRFLIYRKKLANFKVYYSTVDGSFGEKGFITDVLHRAIMTVKINKIFAVGPELMMKKVVEISDEFNIPCQISLERYMKCGSGLCGSCAVDPIGIRMCVEGPCIDKEIAKQIAEFGVYHRDASGKKIYFEK
jgi:dihydroorotate dehydrogenase electron transfer subunit